MVNIKNAKIVPMSQRGLEILFASYEYIYSFHLLSPTNIPTAANTPNGNTCHNGTSFIAEQTTIIAPTTQTDKNRLALPTVE
jgi:hypothetical protein